MSDSGAGVPVGPVPTLQTLVAATTSAAATAAAAPVAGDNNNNQQMSSTAKIIVVVGVLLGIVGVGSVITLIWWMRRRHLARLIASQKLSQPYGSYPPAPPPKSAGAGKPLPRINVASANAYNPSQNAKAAKADGQVKDKALPIKPAESVWSPSERPNRSPALASAHELRAQTTPKMSHDELMGIQRGRADSVDKEPVNPTNFV